MSSSTQQQITEWIKHYAPLLNIPESILQPYLLSLGPLPEHVILHFLHLAHQHQLDPILGEIQVMPADQGPQVFITMDGWMKIMNLHPHFQGLSLRESTATEVSEQWMECCIYRDDRILPIVVKEYLIELQTDHPSWQQMPRRMLRHRTIQQCARLAFGIASPEARETIYPVHIVKPDLKKHDSEQDHHMPTSAQSRSNTLKKKLAKHS
jgi:hypothetical protein